MDSAPEEHTIPGMGAVSLRSPTMLSLIHAAKNAHQASKAKKAAAFANTILAECVVAPTVTPAEVACFADDTIAALVEYAVDHMKLRDQFNQLPTDTPARERFYQARRAHDREMKQTLGYTNFYDKMAALQQATALSPAVQAAMEQQARIQAMVGPSSLMGISSALAPTGLLATPPHIDALINNPMARTLASNAQLVATMNLAAYQGIPDQLLAFHTAAQNLYRDPLPLALQKLAGISLPEPFLSDALITAGLNVPSIHTRTYPVPRVKAAETKEQLEARAQEARQQRMVDAYDICSRAEQQLRDFIEERLGSLHEKAWWKRGVPDAIRRDCEERKAKRETPFEPKHHPITYAYIGNYKDIILRKDNWGAVFAAVFPTKEELEACFIWLNRARDPIMHSRGLSDDEYQRLVVAARWLHTQIERVCQRGSSAEENGNEEDEEG